MATSPKLVETADQFLAKRRFNFFFYSFDVGRYWFEVQVGRSAGDENILCSFFFPQIRSWLHFPARWNIHCVQLWIMFTLALLTSFSGVAMVKRGIGAFCMAETNPLARRAKLLSADQSDSVQLGSAGFGSRRFLAVFGVQSRFWGWSPSDPDRWAAGRSQWVRRFVSRYGGVCSIFTRNDADFSFFAAFLDGMSRFSVFIFPAFFFLMIRLVYSRTSTLCFF